MLKEAADLRSASLVCISLLLKYVSVVVAVDIAISVANAAAVALVVSH